ncbi:MAG: hypothetical protein KGZ85_00420 [Ignavibacterium sp.]|nr:hypothetical protein [Ignavibacterium sp.]
MKHSLIKIETELKKRLIYPYIWGRKQNDLFDNVTNFIYRINSFDEVLKEIETRFKMQDNYKDYFNYALNRWYNFWSAQCIEQIFCSMPGVKPALDEKDKLIDFTINDVTFDHKTSVYPKNFPHKIEDAIKHTDEMIKWLYRNQSQQKRKHLKNRLFVVLYSNNREDWKLKAEIGWLKERIEKYMLGFNPDYLMKFEFEKGKVTFSDIIWAIK